MSGAANTVRNLTKWYIPNISEFFLWNEAKNLFLFLWNLLYSSLSHSKIVTLSLINLMLKLKLHGFFWELRYYLPYVSRDNLPFWFLKIAENMGQIFMPREVFRADWDAEEGWKRTVFSWSLKKIKLILNT